MTSHQAVATIDDLAEFLAAGVAAAGDDAEQRRQVYLTAIRSAYLLGVRRVLEASLSRKDRTAGHPRKVSRGPALRT